MKRKIAVLLLTAFVAGLCAAEGGRRNFIQRGNATSGKAMEGLYADHPSLPIGSSAIVTNTHNGLETKIIIAGRIAASSGRIIDISQDAASILKLEGSGEVIVYVPDINDPASALAPEPDLPVIAEAPSGTALREASLPEPELNPELIKEKPPAPPYEDASARRPVNITLYSYFINPDSMEFREKPEDMDYIEWLALMALESRTRKGKIASPAVTNEETKKEEEKSVETLPVVEIPAAEEKEEKPEETPAVTEASPPAPQPESKIRIIPGLSNIKSGKLYRFHVGDFPTLEAADDAYRKMRGAGFNVMEEEADSSFSVTAVDIPAEIVPYAVKRLELMGFSQVWIQE